MTGRNYTIVVAFYPAGDTTCSKRDVDNRAVLPERRAPSATNPQAGVRLQRPLRRAGCGRRSTTPCNSCSMPARRSTSTRSSRATTRRASRQASSAPNRASSRRPSRSTSRRRSRRRSRCSRLRLSRMIRVDRLGFGDRDDRQRVDRNDEPLVSPEPGVGPVAVHRVRRFSAAIRVGASRRQRRRAILGQTQRGRLRVRHRGSGRLHAVVPARAPATRPGRSRRSLQVLQHITSGPASPTPRPTGLAATSSRDGQDYVDGSMTSRSRRASLKPASSTRSTRSTNCARPLRPTLVRTTWVSWDRVSLTPTSSIRRRATSSTSR